jgi:CDP-4-dehydro-6-deoxyglucose reductase, E3
MTHLLTVSRAARLVGTTRGALQKQIKDGELPTFEGMVKPEDLLRLYPGTRIVDDSALERSREIRESAFARRLRERILPDAETLATRVADLGRELADVRAHLAHCRSVAVALDARLREAATAVPTLAAISTWLQQQLANGPGADESARRLEARNSFLRVMAAHVRLQPSGHEFFVEGNDTLLEAALRAGLALNYGCSSGNCGLCRCRVVKGEAKKVRHHDVVLGAAEKAANTVLLCSYTAVTDLVLEAAEAVGPRDLPRQQIETRVRSIERLPQNIIVLSLQTPRTQRLRFFAGQSATLSAGGATIELPIASCPCDDRNLQFHLRRGDSAFAGLLESELRPGDTVRLDGPQGEFVLDEDSPRPPLFIAWSNGFAPVKSLIEHAMALDVAPAIGLYWGAPDDAGRYMQNLSRAWADALDNFHFTPVTGDVDNPYLMNRVAAEHPDLGEFDVYISGPAVFVEITAKSLLASGLPRTQLRTATIA